MSFLDKFVTDGVIIIKIKIEKPEIAKRAAEEGKIYSFGKEIWRFIVVFLTGSFIAGIIPAIYEMYEFLSDPEMFDKLEEVFLTEDSSFWGMMDLVSDMSDAMYIVTLFCTAILILTVIIYCTKIEKRSCYSTGIVKKNAVSHYGIGLLIGIVSFSLCMLLGVITGVIEINGINKNCNVLIVILYLLGFMIQGFSEEISFRGYFMVSLMKRSSAVKAVLVDSLAFAICHILNPGLNVLAFVNLMIIGIFLSLYVIKTNDIWGAAGYHSMWNFAQGVLYGVSVSGTNVNNSILNSTLDESRNLLSGGEFGIEGSIFTTIVMVAVMVIVMCAGYRKKKES